MIIESEKLKSVSQKILNAVDSNELSVLTETLELKTVDNTLYMNVTNKEYYVRVVLGLNNAEDFHATVNANVFLKLVAQITTETIELEVKENAMIIKGNGVYKLPLIFEDSKLLELPEITINNKVKEFNINSEILESILNYNSKELLRGTISRPIQKLYYIDNEGAITFTSGACVNSFTLAEPVKLLLNNRIVKLFKLFDGEVHFELGYDPLSDDIMQTKVMFKSNDVMLTAIISCDDTLLNSVPVSGIRSRANNTYTYNVTLDKNAFLQMINRLSLFTAMKNTVKPYSTLEFKTDRLTMWDVDHENHEDILYVGNNISGEYQAVLDLVDLKAVVENSTEQNIQLSFGDHQAFVLAKGNIKNIIPEIKVI